MPSQSSKNCSMVVKSRPSAAAQLCSKVLSVLKAANLSQEDVFAIHLALEEAFINAVKHGNAMDADKEVKIDCSVYSDRVEISVTDQGQGFKPDTIPDCRCGDNIYKTSGRGLFLMRAYMNEVRFNERGNCVCMIRHLAKQEQQNHGN